MEKWFEILRKYFLLLISMSLIINRQIGPLRLHSKLGLLFFSGFDFKRMAVEETLKYSRARLVALASALLENVRLQDYHHWGKPGIRAQLLNIRTRKLEMDFVIQGDGKSLHVLNAVSPAWTCSLPFAKYVCDRIEGY